MCVWECLCYYICVHNWTCKLYIHIYIYIYIERERERERCRFWDILKGIHCGGWCTWRMQMLFPPEFCTAHNRIDLHSLTSVPKATYIISSNKKTSGASCLLAIFPGAPISRNLMLKIYNQMVARKLQAQDNSQLTLTAMISNGKHLKVHFL